MAKEQLELIRTIVTAEPITLNDSTIDHINLELHKENGAVAIYELNRAERRDQTIQGRTHYHLPLFRLIDEENRWLEKVLLFDEEAKIVHNERLPFIAIAEPRQDIVTTKVWAEHRRRQRSRVAKIGTFSLAITGIVAGGIVSVYKWRKHQQR